METIQITIDKSLLGLIDSRCGNRNRSSFFRQAAKLLLKELKKNRLETEDEEGYKRHPVKADEFEIWHDEQAWTE